MKQSSIINHQSSMFCSANGAVYTPPYNSRNFSQSIRDFIGSISVVEATVSLQSSIGRIALFLAFILLPVTGWGADEVKLVSVGTSANTSTITFFDNVTYKSSDKSYSVTLNSMNVAGSSKGGKHDNVYDYFYSYGSAVDLSSSITTLLSVKASNCKITKIVVIAHTNGSSNGVLPALAFATEAPAAASKKIGTKTGVEADTIISDITVLGVSAKRFSNAKEYTYTLTNGYGEVMFAKQFKQVVQKGQSSFVIVPSSGQTMCIYGLEVYVIPNGPTTYTVTTNSSNTEYGSVSAAKIENVTSGTSISADGATLTVGTNTVTATPKENTAQYTYDFTDWTWTKSLTTVTEDITATANFTRTTNSYDVTFDMKGHGTQIDKQTKEYGTKVDKPDDPSAEGFDFGGWYKDNELSSTWDFDNDVVTGITTLYAKWQAASQAYDITFVNGGHGTAPTGITASNTTLTALSETGYTCTGWKADVDVKVNDETVTAGTLIANGTKVFVTQNTTFTAQWSTNTHKLAWETDGDALTGEYTHGDAVAYGTTIVAPNTPTKTGYTFAAWDPAFVAETTMPDNDLTYTATWTANKHNVTFDLGGGSGYTDMTNVAYGSNVDVSTAPTKTGCEFLGWTSSPSVTITNGHFSMPDNDVALTATYKKVPVVIFSMSNVSSSSTKLKNNATKAVSATYVGGSALVGCIDSSDKTVLGTNCVSLGGNNAYLLVSLANDVTLLEGDTIKFVSTNSLYLGTTNVRSTTNAPTNNVYIVTNSDGLENSSTLSVWRQGSTPNITGVTIIRPAAKDTASVDVELSDLKVNDTSISSDSLATLKDLKTLTLKDKYMTAPQITFVEKTTVTFTDETYKVKTQNIVKQAESASEGFFAVSATIGGIEYTISAPVMEVVKAYFYDGSNKLGEINVEKGTAPKAADYAAFQVKPLYAFDNWYSDPDLQNAADMTASISTATSYYGKWEKQYATTVDFMAEAVKSSPQTISTFLNTYHYAMSSLDNVSWDAGVGEEKDRGLKVENVSRTLSFWVEAGKKVSIKVGTLNRYGSDATVNTASLTMNGGEPVTILANSTTDYTTTEETEFRITTKNKSGDDVSWNLFQKITITDNKFNVTYDGNGNTGGEAPVDSNNPYIGGTSVTVLGNASLEKTGYTFNCWNTKSDGLGDDLSATEPYGTFTITKDTTLYAKWTVNSHNLTWEVNGGTITSGESDYTHGSVAYGTTIVPPTVEKTDCDFIGWNTTVAASMPDNDLTYTAQWKAAAQKFDISFNNGGHGTAPDGINASNVTLAAITGVTGYTCTGWVADVDTKVNETTITAGNLIENGTQVFVQQNTTFTAQWSTNTHKLAWETDGDELTGEYTHGDAVAYGTTIVAPNTPTKTGYTFAAWDPAFVAETTMPDNDLTYTATWTAKQYIISYKDEGDLDYSGSNLSSLPASHTYGTATALVNGVRVGYTFVGWFTTSACDGTAITSVAGDAYTDNFTLYAKWEKINGNHYIYAFDDADHYVGGTYKTPEGTTAATDGKTHDLTNPYTLFSSTDGITSVVVNTGKYDAKTGDIQHICSYIKVKTDAGCNIVFTIASGYEAVLKLKMGGYSTTPTVSLKDAGENSITASGTISGVAETKNNYAEITYNLSAGAYTLTTSGQNLYVSHIDLLATKLAADVSLADIKIKGTTIPGFASGNYNYNYKYAYKSTISASDVSYTATAPADVNITTFGNVPGTYVIKVSAKTKPELYKEYTINISEGPKDPTCILKATLTSGSDATLTGLYKDSVNAAIKTSGFSSGGYKLGSDGNYAGFETKQGNQFAFLPGDIFNVYVVKTSSVLEVYSDKGSNKVASTSTVEADKLHTLPIDFGSSASFKNIYLYRTSSSMNPYITYIEIMRPMNPVLTAIKITDFAGTEHAGVINGNTITFNEEFHFMTDLKNLNIAYTIASNDNSKVTKTIANQWVSGEANTLTLTDKDGDATSYTITVNVTPSEVVRTGLSAGKIVTYCNSKNVIAHDGAKFYYISGKATDLSSIELTEVTGELVAGFPYIVEAEKKEIRVVYGNKEETTAQEYNGLHGVLGETVTLVDGDYLIKNNKYYRAHTGNNNTIVDGRAFLRLSEIESVSNAPGESTPAPSPRRIILGTDEVNVATGFNAIGETDLGEPQKFIINNQVVIIRNGQMYNAQGALLK